MCSLTEKRLWAKVHLAICKRVLGSKKGYIFEHQWEHADQYGQRISVSVLDVDVDTFQTPGDTLARMSDLKQEEFFKLSPEELKEKYPRLYRSMLYHFMSIKYAVQMNWGADAIYPHHEDLSPYWAHEVVPFLNKLSDEQIAKMCCCSPQRIADIRLLSSLRTFVAFPHVSRTKTSKPAVEAVGKEFVYSVGYAESLWRQN